MMKLTREDAIANHRKCGTGSRTRRNGLDGVLTRLNIFVNTEMKFRKTIIIAANMI